MKIDEEWLKAYYSEVGREIGVANSQLHDTTNWAIGITTAAVTAIVVSGKAYPQIWTLGLVAAAFILTFRFFIRSCLAYTNLMRWNCIHKAITQYGLTNDPNERQEFIKKIKNAMDIYHIKWRSPLSISKLLIANLKLGYGFLFLILGSLSVIGFSQANWHNPNTWIIFIFFVGSLAYEIAIFPSRSYFKHEQIPD